MSMPQPSAEPLPHAAPRLTLPANGTRIVFLHARDTGLCAPCAVQVDVKTPPPREGKAGENMTPEISDLLVKLIVSHLRTPLPAKFVLNGDAYNITAARKEWKYGQKKLLMTWGDERIVPCADKWSFAFAWTGEARSWPR